MLRRFRGYKPRSFQSLWNRDQSGGMFVRTSPFDHSIMICSHTEIGAGIQVIREGSVEFRGPTCEQVLGSTGSLVGHDARSMLREFGDPFMMKVPELS
jgi:hypothetical protein